MTATFSALASEPVQTQLWDGPDPIPHTRLGQQADLVIVVPATARIIGAYAAGLSTDLLTNVLLATRALRKPGSLVVGFALETGDALRKGREKLERKLLDLIVVNDATEPGAGFEVATNRVTIVAKDGAQWEVALASKASVAESILDRIEAALV